MKWWQHVLAITWTIYRDDLAISLLDSSLTSLPITYGVRKWFLTRPSTPIVLSFMDSHGKFGMTSTNYRNEIKSTVAISKFQGKQIYMQSGAVRGMVFSAQLISTTATRLTDRLKLTSVVLYGWMRSALTINMRDTFGGTITHHGIHVLVRM